MRVVINGKLYDSTVTPILIIFDENEKEMFNMNRFVSAPANSTEEERTELIKTNINDLLDSQTDNLKEGDLK